MSNHKHYTNLHTGVGPDIMKGLNRSTGGFYPLDTNGGLTILNTQTTSFDTNTWIKTQ